MMPLSISEVPTKLPIHAPLYHTMTVCGLLSFDRIRRGAERREKTGNGGSASSCGVGELGVAA